jgi:hypothetical protein
MRMAHCVDYKLDDKMVLLLDLPWDTPKDLPWESRKDESLEKKMVSRKDNRLD